MSAWHAAIRFAEVCLAEAWFVVDPSRGFDEGDDDLYLYSDDAFDITLWSSSSQKLARHFAKSGRYRDDPFRVLYTHLEKEALVFKEKQALLFKSQESTIAKNEADSYITLDQAAARVNRAKRTLEKALYRKKNPMPDPDIQGMGGKPNEWLWSKIRPWLEQEYGRKLPETLPSTSKRGLTEADRS